MRALAFSGGKDSLACWFLLQEENPLVLWVNTGKAYPETLAIMQMVRERSQLIEIQSDQSAQNAKSGLPVDLVVADNTRLGEALTTPKDTIMQPYFQCCYENLALPLLAKAIELGVTELVFGQRFGDSHKGLAQDGTVINGIRRSHPIESWTEEEVLVYLRTKMELPEHLLLKHSSLDCYDCTAFLSESADKHAWAQKTHPILFAAYKKRLDAVMLATKPTWDTLVRMQHG